MAPTVTRICVELINRVDNKRFFVGFYRMENISEACYPPSDVMDVPPSPQLHNINMSNLNFIEFLSLFFHTWMIHFNHFSVFASGNIS